MRHRHGWFLLAAVLVAVWAFGFPSRGVAPAFRGKTMQGEAFSNESLKGKTVLLQFWATWCGYCRRDQPAVDEIAAEYAGRVTVLAVNVNESRKTVQRYLAAFPRACKVVLTEDTDLTEVFTARGFPMYVVLDREGRVAVKNSGAGGAAHLRRMLASAGVE